MKALLPVFCRPLGYVILILALFLPFLLAMAGKVTDNNLLFYKECTKMLMMCGAILILLALSKNESFETEKIRIAAIRNAVFLTFIFIFGGMIYRFAIGDVVTIDTSSFLIFMIFNVLCLEFGMKKSVIDKIFKK
ncbi:MAG: hypothetical protein LUH22_08640 [Bacteroides sp.]|nr:hypothetical protein [Bacteroides sp.]